MSPSSQKNALRDAIFLEKLRAQRIKWRYAALSKKIAAYSDGGVPPTPEEFKTWTEDGKELDRIRAIQLSAVKDKQS
jgi:hypothetical protein